MKKVIAYIEIGDMKTSSASEMVEAFNWHFANIGHDLARDIPSADTVPKRYLISTNATFSFKSCSSNEVRKLLEKLDTKKSTELDNCHPGCLKWRPVFWHLHPWHSCSISRFSLVLIQLNGS